MHADVQDAVILRQGAVMLARKHLQRPEAQQDNGDSRDHQRRQDGYANVEAIGQPRRDVLGSL